MKHKHEWTTTGNSTRCEICGKRKKKPFVDKEALAIYYKEWCMKHKKGATT